MRKCTKCNISKIESEFGNSKRVIYVCNPCRSIISAAARKATKLANTGDRVCAKCQIFRTSEYFAKSTNRIIKICKFCELNISDRFVECSSCNIGKCPLEFKLMSKTTMKFSPICKTCHKHPPIKVPVYKNQFDGVSQICSQCSIRKELGEFNKNNAIFNGYSYVCKVCTKEQRLNVYSQEKIVPAQIECNECHVHKSPSEFYINSIKLSGYDSICIICNKKRKKIYRQENAAALSVKAKEKHRLTYDPIKKREYYEKNRIHILNHKKIYRQENIQKLTEYLKAWQLKNKDSLILSRKAKSNKIKKLFFDKFGAICNYCGITDKSILTIDHVNNNGKHDRKNRGPNWKLRFLKNPESIDYSQYQILCRNCNCGKAIKDGVNLRPKAPVGQFKLCPTCSINKDESEFHLYGARGYYYECNTCVSNRKISTKKECFSLFGGLCINCGESDFQKLNIDHKINNGSFRRKLGERSGTSTYRKITSGEYEKEDFDLLCWNCNIKKYHSSRINQPVEDFNFKDLIICELTNKDLIKKFLNAYHYSGYGREPTLVVGCYLKDRLIGLVKYSHPVRQEVAVKSGYEFGNMLELDRFCIDDKYHKKNFSSFLISSSIKKVRSMSHIKCLVSFADPYYGHDGTIYKASNWVYEGETRRSYFYESPSGDNIHKKTIYNWAKSKQMTESEACCNLGLKRIRTPKKIKFIYPM